MLTLAILLSAQLTIGSTNGTLPPATPTKSLLLGDDLDDFRSAWVAPLNPYQQTWRDNANARAGQTPSGSIPGDFGVAATDASIAQAAGLRWVMTGSSADLQKAVDVLLLANVPNSGTTITRPEVMTSYLCAYDFVRGASFTELPQSTRNSIESRLLSEAQSLGSGLTNSNAKGKIGATRALAGLLLMDQGLLDRGLRDLQDHFDYSTTNDGWFTDSQGHYLNYTLSHIGPFVRAYHQGSGVDLYPNLEPYVHMSLGMRMPNGAVPNVSNGTNTPVGINLFTQSTNPASASHALWNILEGKAWSPCWAATNLFNNDWTYSRFFALNDNVDVASVEPGWSPTFLTRGQSGVSVFREHWGKTSDFLMLSPGVDSPKGIFSIPAFHSHNDTAELLLCAEGEYLLVAPGYERTDLPNSPPGFTPKRADWHNVMLVDGDVGSSEAGRKLRPGDFRLTNRLDSLENGGFSGVCDFTTLEVDYRSVAVRRSVAFPGEDYFLVCDRLTPQNNSSHDYGFNLVGRGTRTVQVNTSETVSVRWEHLVGRVTATVFATGPMQLATASLHMHDRYNVFEPTQRMTATQSSQRKAAFLTVFEPGTAGGAEALDITEINAGNNALAAKVEHSAAGWTDHALLQETPQVRAAGPIASDASFAWIRQDASTLEAATMSAGKTLAVNGALVLEASSPATISLRLAPLEWHATISPDDLAPQSELRIYGIGDILTANMNGAPVSFTNGETYHTISLGTVSAAGDNLLHLTLAPPGTCGYQTYGYGASAANVLRLTGTGTPSPGSVINAVVEGVNDVEALVVAATASDSTPFLGGILLVNRSTVRLKRSGPVVSGTASVPIPILNDPGLIGRSFYLQAAARDTGLPGGWALSQGLEITICP